MQADALVQGDECWGVEVGVVLLLDPNSGAPLGAKRPKEVVRDMMPEVEFRKIIRELYWELMDLEMARCGGG